MVRFILLSAAVCAMTYAATTVGPGSGTTLGHLDAKILYDFQHHKAMLVRADGCYEYHMNHQDVEDAKNDATKAILEARMVQELSQAVNVVESGHHHIDHMTQEIRSACASVPVYQWELATAPVGK